jgi:hypothetical protein
VTGSRSLTFSTSRRPARRRWVRVVVGLVVVALLVVVGAALIAGSLWTYAWVRLGGTDLPSLTAAEDSLGAGGATSPEGTTTVLVALTEPTDQEGSQAAALAGPVALVQVGGPREDDAAVVLLPPQLPVTVDGEPTTPLGEVHRTAGPDALVRSVVDYTQIAVDHVVTASADAVPGMVESLGPVEVCHDACRTVDAEAVRAALATYTDPAAAPTDVAGAFGELAAVIRGLAAEADPAAVLASPFATRRAIDVLADDVTTDASLRGAAALPIADRIATSGDVAVVTLPGVVNPDSGELLVLPEQAATRFALLREGGVPTQSTADDEAALLADATVAVQNGTGTTGYAATLETRLAALGVRVVGTENAASFDVERTRVAYGPDDPAAEATAVLIARELGDVELVALDRAPTFEGAPVTVQVVGGADLDTGASDDQET